jgi:hypothetical protein
MQEYHKLKELHVCLCLYLQLNCDMHLDHLLQVTVAISTRLWQQAGVSLNFHMSCWDLTRQLTAATCCLQCLRVPAAASCLWCQAS